MWAGGARVVQELAKKLGLTPQQVVTKVRRDNSAKLARIVALEIAEGVMGRVAWEHYSKSKYKELKGARKPAGLPATEKKNRDRKEELGGSMKGLTLQTPLDYFKDVDTKWKMDTKFVWLSPEGDIIFTNTLGDMISEAFHAKYSAKKTRGVKASKLAKKL